MIFYFCIIEECKKCNIAFVSQILFRTFALDLGLNGRPDGGIGRHAGLKILWTERSVPVRPRLRVLKREVQCSSFSFLLLSLLRFLYLCQRSKHLP